jgi:hypothetical protein
LGEGLGRPRFGPVVQRQARRLGGLDQDLSIVACPESVPEALSSLAKGELHAALQSVEGFIFEIRPKANAQDGAGDFGGWPEGRRVNAADPLDLATELAHDREAPVGLAARWSEKTLRDLLLQHEDRVSVMGPPPQGTNEKRPRDVVRQVAAQGASIETRPGHVERVALADLDVLALGEVGSKKFDPTPVLLDGEDRPQLREAVGEQTGAWTDLDARGRRGATDGVQDPGVDQEVLPQALLGGGAGGDQTGLQLGPKAHERLSRGQRARTSSVQAERSPRSRRSCPALAIMAPLSVQKARVGRRSSIPDASAR